jgi:hypothetical protein
MTDPADNFRKLGEALKPRKDEAVEHMRYVGAALEAAAERASAAFRTFADAYLATPVQEEPT